MPSLKAEKDGPDRSLTRRMLLGKEVEVGVAGRTLTEWCGLRLDAIMAEGVLETLVETEPVLLVELALLWLWWWVAWCMLRIEDTEDEVLLRPRNPGPEERRMTVPRGVRGEGERDWRLYAVEVVVVWMRWLLPGYAEVEKWLTGK